MTGLDLRAARKSKGWTQQKAAGKLRVSQAYLSMLERDRRHLPTRLVRRFSKAYDLAPLALPFHGAESWQQVEAPELATQLAALGYPGFSYMKGTAEWNPAELLLVALGKDQLEARVVEALPWLALQYPAMDWDWVMREAKVRDLTNRLGFVLTLAREVAEQNGGHPVAERLGALELQLQRSVLAREDTLCYEHMTQAERRWLREKSSAQARRWNVLSNLAPEHLSHGA